MRQPVRSFAIGLFTAGVIMLIGFYLFDSSTKQAEDLPVDTMIPLIEDKGYHVMTEEEYISVSVTKDDANQKEKSKENTKTEEVVKGKEKETEKQKEKEKKKKETEKNNADKETSDDKKDDIVKFTLNIESGMLSSSISELLEKNKIIDDGQKFNSYLEEHEYESKVQLGNFELNSEMTFNEIAEEITK